MIAFGVGAVATLLVLVAARGWLRAPVLQRVNYRGHQLATAGGLVAVGAVMATVLVSFGIGSFTDPEPVVRGDGWTVLAVFLGFAALGVLDDLVGSGADRGFRGHVSALVHGRVTTGAVKLVGGVVLAIVAVARLGDGGVRTLVGAAVVAGAANLANLFDRAPLRVIKVGFVCWIPASVAGLVATEYGSVERSVVVVGALCVGALLALAPADAAERLMLGDTGANALGAVVGFVVVATTGTVAQLVVLAVIVALNVASERVSFTVVIDRTPWLRRLDRAGRRP